MAKISVFCFYCVFASLSYSFAISATIRSEYDSNQSLTFKWYDNVTTRRVEPDYYPHRSKHLAELTDIYEEIDGTYFLEGTDFPSQSADAISWRPSGGFVDTVFYSYQNHHNLIIRPDDVWTAIVVQFSMYINANAEALRHSFVNFEGKKQLEVRFYAPINRISIGDFIQKIVYLIDENIDPSISDWIKPNFTTTTVDDELTSGAALMATVQKYFEYNLSLILCGIPELTILGDVDDWIDIRKRVNKLSDFEMNGQNVMATWSSMLGRILDEFVNVKMGREKDEKFWKQAIRVDYEEIDLGCARMNETYLNGWITAFSAFDRLGKWRSSLQKIDNLTDDNDSQWFRIRTDSITPGMVHVPIKIYDEYAKPEEREYTGAIITGHMGHSVRRDEVTLQPLSGWGMMITNNPPDYLQNKNVQSSQLSNRNNNSNSKSYFRV